MKKKIVIIIGIVLTIVDQLIKLLVDKKIALAANIKVIKNFFYVTKTYNYGASWSIMQGQRILLILLSIVFLVVLYKFMDDFKKDNKLNVVSFSIIVGGLLGNLVDRIFRGYVIDYLNFYIFKYDFPVFNFADCLIVVGVIILLIRLLMGDGNENKSRSK